MFNKMSMPSIRHMIASAVVVCLVVWGGLALRDSQAKKTATLRRELEQNVREELRAEAVREEVKAKTVRVKLEAEAALRTQLEKNVREQLKAEAAVRTQLEKKVREELNAEVALRTELEKKVREELKAEAGAEISALERQKLFESGMAYTTRNIYEIGMSDGKIKGQDLVQATEVWALGTVHGERSGRGENAGPGIIPNGEPETMHNVGLEAGHNAGSEGGHNAGSEGDHSPGPRGRRNAGLGRGRNAGARSGHVSRRIRGARHASSTEASDDGREEQRGGHR